MSSVAKQSGHTRCGSASLGENCKTIDCKFTSNLCGKHLHIPAFGCSRLASNKSAPRGFRKSHSPIFLESCLFAGRFGICCLFLTWSFAFYVRFVVKVNFTSISHKSLLKCQSTLFFAIFNEEMESASFLKCHLIKVQDLFCLLLVFTIITCKMRNIKFKFQQKCRTCSRTDKFKGISVNAFSESQQEPIYLMLVYCTQLQVGWQVFSIKLM